MMLETQMVRRTIAGVAVATVALLHTAPAAEACSRVLWNTNDEAVVVGRTLDWEHDWNEYIFAYPRGRTTDGGPGDNPVAWTSKYGSVVTSLLPFAKNYEGFDLNDGGMEGINEEGLAVHLLVLEETEYVGPNGLPTLNYLRWTNYLLDNFATVEEAVEGMRKVRVVPVPMGDITFGAHAAIEDATGDSAIIEFIDGNLVIHHGKEFTVMTNDPAYPAQLENLERFEGFGGDEVLRGTTESDDRFVRLSYYLNRLEEPEDAADALAKIYAVTRTAAVPFDADEYGPTWWMSLSDLTNKVYYFNWTQNPNIVWIDLKQIDFSEGSGIRMLNPRLPSAVGDMSSSFEEASLERIAPKE